MDYWRQTIDSEKLLEILDLPDSFRGRQVEVIVLPVESAHAPTGTAYGCLRKYADPAKVSEESGAWARAMAGKHATR